MNIIHEKRETVIKENNTAQTQLLGILDSLNKSSQQLRIVEPLYGDINLIVLEELGFKQLKDIQFEKGEITSIIGIPEGVVSFSCIDNYLIELESAPTTLRRLELTHNYLTSMDLDGLKDLDTLILTDNQFDRLENFPPSLSNLSCESNRLTHLDLRTCPELRVLHISNNAISLIENLPTGIVDFQMENNPAIEFRNSSIIPDPNPTTDTEEEMQFKKKQTYKENLNEYFKLKRKYETEVSKLKRTTYNAAPTKRMGKQAVLAIKPKCIKCKRPVGTIFANKDRYYTAICGDSVSPCNLNMKIHNGGELNPIYSMLDVFKESIDQVKESIIIRKLDTLFNYVSEEESVRLFKKEIELYNEQSELYKPIFERYNDLYHSDLKKTLIEKKQGDIFVLIENIRGLLSEYQKTDNIELLKTAMKLQNNELTPELRNLRILKYEDIHMESEMVGNREEFTLVCQEVVAEKSEFRL
jgi:hypothetical protein